MKRFKNIEGQIMEEYTEKHLWSILRKNYLNVMQKKRSTQKM